MPAVQPVQPVAVPTAPAAPAAPVATTTAPATTAAPRSPTMISVPVVQQAPAATEVAPPPAESAEAAAPAREAPAAAARTAPAERTASAPVSREPANDGNMGPMEAPVAPLAPLAPVDPALSSPYGEPVEPIAAPVDEAPVSTTEGTSYAALVAGVLLIPALALLAFLPWRRRRAAKAKPMPEQVIEPRSEPLPGPEPMVAPAIAQPAIAQPAYVPEPAVASEIAPRPVYAFEARPRAAQPDVKGALPAAGASVPLPAKMPENFAERDALLKRMAAAKPDRANPFTDYRARMKRARLILQSLGRTFADADPWIDLSQYPNNWPELARRKRIPQAA